jgi:hypothetical protein
MHTADPCSVLPARIVISQSDKLTKDHVQLEYVSFKNRKRSIRPYSTIVDAQESKQLRCFDCRVQPVYIYSPFGGHPVRNVDDNEPTIWQVINIHYQLLLFSSTQGEVTSCIAAPYCSTADIHAIYSIYCRYSWRYTHAPLGHPLAVPTMHTSTP